MNAEAAAGDPQAPREAGWPLRVLGRLSRAVPYFPGRWRLMEWVSMRWFAKTRWRTDVRLNASTVITCNLWDEVQFDIWWGGESFELGPVRYFKSQLAPGHVVLDIGSNIGYYALIAAPLVGRGGQVHAFEPMPQQFRRLEENAQRNGFAQVRALELALSDRTGPAVIHLSEASNTGSASLRPMSGSVQNVTIQCTTLDAYADAAQLTRVDVVKIDVEGMELAVLAGGERTLTTFRPVCLVEVRETMQQQAGFSRAALYQWFRDRDYEPCRIRRDGTLATIEAPEDGVLIAFRPLERNHAGTMGSRHTKT